MSKKYCFLCEGETEESVLKALSIIGQVIKFNICEHNADKVIRRIKGNCYVIYDTDIIDNKNIARFRENVKILQQKTNLIGFLQQTNNLEDELVRSSKVKIQDLQKHFHASGQNELKTKINKSNNLFERLQQIGFNADLMWRQATIKQLQQLSIKRVYYQDLPKHRLSC